MVPRIRVGFSCAHAIETVKAAMDRAAKIRFVTVYLLKNGTPPPKRTARLTDISPA
jgi:hypothetical protein